MTIAQPVPVVTPFRTLEQAAEAVADLVSASAGMRLWLVAKIEGERWIPLAVRDEHYRVRRGRPELWLDALCARVASGRAPVMITDTAGESAVADLARSLGVAVGSYVCHPIHDGRGMLFGAVCAFDPEAGRFEEALMLPRLRAAAQVITSHLALEEQVEDTRRRAERAELESRTDPMTSVLNRRGWELAMTQEQARIARTGSSAAIVLVDLDGLKIVNDSQGHEAGDELIVRCARVLANQVRSRDVVGRLGGDEFAMLLAGIDRQLAGQVIERIRQALINAQVNCTLTWSWAGVLGSLEEALAEADMLLIEHKKRHGRSAGLQMEHPA
jgi:diguanylate cyclase (GGDEF)-like protein